MGMKRTKFRPKTDELGERGYGLDTEEKIPLDLKKAKELRMLWVWLMLEMIFVMILVLVSFFIGLWYSAEGLKRTFTLLRTL